MEHYTPEELAAMSGEAAYRAPRGLELNEVSLNGDGEIVDNGDGTYSKKGGFFRKRILVGRKDRNERPEEVNLGQDARLVFLKIRRKLVERGKDGKIVRSTNEHNHKNEVVTLYQELPLENETGIAADLRAKYDGLRTVQIVYALLLHGTQEPELVRLVIKGSSLGSEAKAENVMDFYRYLASFPKDEHVWEFVTTLTPVLEKGAKQYYSINFQKGEALADDMKSLAISTLKDVHAKCQELDQARMAKVVASAPVERTIEAGDDTPADDTGEVNPDDISF